MLGYLVRIDYSQSEHDTVFVKGVYSMEEAIAAVKKSTSCPRVYQSGTVDKVITVPKKKGAPRRTMKRLGAID